MRSEPHLSRLMLNHTQRQRIRLEAQAAVKDLKVDMLALRRWIQAKIEHELLLAALDTISETASTPELLELQKTLTAEANSCAREAGDSIPYNKVCIGQLYDSVTAEDSRVTLLKKITVIDYLLVLLQTGGDELGKKNLLQQLNSQDAKVIKLQFARAVHTSIVYLAPTCIKYIKYKRQSTLCNQISQATVVPLTPTLEEKFTDDPTRPTLEEKFKARMEAILSLFTPQPETEIEKTETSLAGKHQPLSEHDLERLLQNICDPENPHFNVLHAKQNRLNWHDADSIKGYKLLLKKLPSGQFDNLGDEFADILTPEATVEKANLIQDPKLRAAFIKLHHNTLIQSQAFANTLKAALAGLIELHMQRIPGIHDGLWWFQAEKLNLVEDKYKALQTAWALLKGSAYPDVQALGVAQKVSWALHNTFFGRQTWFVSNKKGPTMPALELLQLMLHTDSRFAILWRHRNESTPGLPKIIKNLQELEAVIMSPNYIDVTDQQVKLSLSWPYCLDPCWETASYIQNNNNNNNNNNE
jgi:hypothetical protein